MLKEVNGNLGEYAPTQHPVYIAPTPDGIKAMVKKLGADKAAELLQLREDKITAERMDPYRHGYAPDHWTDADRLLEEHDEMLVLGGNRAGKTEWAARKTVNRAVHQPEARLWCLHTTHQSSIAMQQNVIWKYLPAEFKLAKKNKITNIGYTQKNGFSENTMVLPNRSQIWFLNYAQDRRVIEGGELDMIWCDELVPLDWLETLRYRLVTRRGKLVITFTPITGYTQVVKSYLAGATITSYKESDLLAGRQNVPGIPAGTMPYTMRCHQKNAAVICFHSAMNPYSPYDQLKRTLEGRSPYEKKIRAYGWAERLQGTQFPKFGELNVVPRGRVPQTGTNYMAIDPAGARNWFMLWVRVDDLGRKWVYREWPSMDIGEWALPSDKADGKAGLGQTNTAGRGIIEYKQLIRDLEGDEEVVERYIDPRAGGTQAAGKDGGTSLVELIEDDPDPMTIIPAAGLRIDEGISLVNDWLSWNDNEPLSPINEPKLYVSEDCPNLIYSLREWTGGDGDKGATKDPIDCLRYLAVMDPQHNGAERFSAVQAGGSY